MRQRYDALVIGTGFGGSVAACRLAQAGLSVGILERGRRYGLGEFPRDWSDPAKGWLWQHEQGLYDVRPVNEMTIVQGAAYGGGSHLYANVHLRMPADGFATGWPAGYRRTTLDPYYDLVAYMLDLTAIGEDQPLGVPMKTLRMEKVAADLGRSEQFCRPTLAVMLVFFFIWTWNEFLIPLTFLISNDNQTVPVAISLLQGDKIMDVTTTSASALLGLLPTLVFFLIFQRTLSRGITAGAVK